MKLKKDHLFLQERLQAVSGAGGLFTWDQVRNADHRTRTGTANAQAWRDKEHANVDLFKAMFKAGYYQRATPAERAAFWGPYNRHTARIKARLLRAVDAKQWRIAGRLLDHLRGRMEDTTILYRATSDMERTLTHFG